MGCPHVRCFPRTFCAWPCLLRQVGTILGSPYDYVLAGLAYANPGSRHNPHYIGTKAQATDKLTRNYDFYMSAHAGMTGTKTASIITDKGRVEAAGSRSQ